MKRSGKRNARDKVQDAESGAKRIGPRAPAMEAKMRQIMLKMLAVGASALGLIAFGGSASAAPALLTAEGLGQVGSLIMPAMDEETLAVEKDLRPDEVPEDMKDEGAPKAPSPEPSEGKSGSNMEDEMIDKIGPGAE